MSTRLLAMLLIALAFVGAGTAHAEPYLAVVKGMKCANCHTSPSGGGLRTAYGNVFAQLELPANPTDPASIWNGEISRYLAVGADVRGGWREIDTPGQPAISDTDLDRALAYVELRPLPDVLSLYVDAKVAPDDVEIREQYVRVRTRGGRWSLRYGEFFLPYGLRLQDDGAFIRSVSGINFNTPDHGAELGFEQGAWTAQLAVTRGTAGGPEIDSGKQYSLRVAHVTDRWRAGGSFNLNDSSAGDRQMQNVFGGLRTGPVAWLAELGYIIDDGTPTGRRSRWTGLAEANYGYRQGHNLKLTVEWFDPDDDVDEDEQNRFSLVWEYTPFRFVQGRIGLRRYDGIPQNPAQNRREAFAEIHLLF